jgi:hypothetical protein
MNMAASSSLESASRRRYARKQGPQSLLTQDPTRKWGFQPDLPHWVNSADFVSKVNTPAYPLLAERFVATAKTGS